MSAELTISPGTELQPAALFTPTPQAAQAHAGVLHRNPVKRGSFPRTFTAHENRFSSNFHRT